MRVLTGLQPSGDLHIGNFFGAIKPMIEAQETSEMFIFIANYHAMTSSQKGEILKQNALKAAAAFLSLGVDHQKSVFWLQSDVKEVLELYWILSQFSPMGLLERAHSYKDKVAKGLPSSHGLFSYPVLMAADILLFDTQIVPVGKDQIQHVEIARDIALKVNNEWGEIFTLPEAKVSENVAVVPGTDGAKMSKSYQNTIDIFAGEKLRKKQISSIVTDSTPLEEPKNWQDCNVFKIAKLFLSKEKQEELKGRYEKGGEGYGHFKAYLNELVGAYFKEAQENYENYLKEPKKLEEILEFGASKARKIAQLKMQKIYDKIGL
ncbi:tryptophan--tRNA ligase [Campylobacter upsaliensis]|uniref:Tryptophan--tRNA ligase n=1 Tax=Campylobacter upsaliensis TaxID=28080 RepID=A0A5M1DPS7_CAMUP|nr:tryptophan--tRNA ligase [Campylobacter upsaliensis]EAI2900736.1 tryptophan--tRNA ligase [Campylobacter upsaliensis]EAI9945458.1 tryptophan--tRNA ligase [Campylobacter upsaliensis]EAK1468249.1 tryptophan--tRNA ligase [Campylobacter upsaliensis]ECV9716923.1 tryptophan--tRNA ligase [Campylobacter upsaliensis]ECV9718969.1 tryptophan--tRNA ligase [Campylobacter upsaliensis]